MFPSCNHHTAIDDDGRTAGATAGGLLLAFLCLAGCVQEMANQPRVDAYERSAFFPDGLGARPQVAGTMSRDQAWDETPLTSGRQDGQLVERMPVAVTAELLQRGRERYRILCVHCHGWSGYGDGMVVQRGFPAPPSYHSDRLHAATDGHLFDVISHGIGRMPSFGARTEPADRWAVIAYVRALQLSQHVEASQLSDSDRQQLAGVAPAAPAP